LIFINVIFSFFLALINSGNISDSVLNRKRWNDWLSCHGAQNDKFVCDAERARWTHPWLHSAFRALRHFSDFSFWWRLRHPTQVLLCGRINLRLMILHWHSEDNQLPSIFLKFLLVCVSLGSRPRVSPGAFQSFCAKVV
jgi:hypothetical protein